MSGGPEGGGGGGAPGGEGGKRRRRRRRGGGGGGANASAGPGAGPSGPKEGAPPRSQSGAPKGGHPQQGHSDRQARGGGGGGSPNRGGKRDRPRDRGRDRDRDRDRDKAPPVELRNDLRVARADQKTAKPETPFKHVKRRYGIAIYDTFQAARADLPALAETCKSVDQLNVVIRAEGNMDDPELLALGNVKIFAGTAWALIHDRRVADGWYDEPR